MERRMSVDVAFITVNYNTSQLVTNLIEFFRITELPFSACLVVVDNASSDGSHELLSAAQGEQLVYIPAGENLGYGRAMNLGLATVTSRYACVMNTDLVMNRQALVALWEFFESTPEAGVTSPLILGADGRQQGFIFHQGILSLYSPLICKLRSKVWKQRVERACGPLLVPGVLGAFFMIRRSAFGASELFDRDFFFYYEDTELAHRYWTQGVACYVLPGVSIIHLGGQSTSAAGGRLFQSSRHLYVHKVYGERHARLVGRLDLIRLHLKYWKYFVLQAVVKSRAIRAKYDYYARLVADC
jgi:N-acetylglucosaminyl-diphospho-decaprenol L-rhamnosyltransferase